MTYSSNRKATTNRRQQEVVIIDRLVHLLFMIIVASTIMKYAWKQDSMLTLVGNRSLINRHKDAINSK